MLLKPLTSMKNDTKVEDILQFIKKLVILLISITFSSTIRCLIVMTPMKSSFKDQIHLMKEREHRWRKSWKEEFRRKRLLLENLQRHKTFSREIQAMLNLQPLELYLWGPTMTLNIVQELCFGNIIQIKREQLSY